VSTIPEVLFVCVHNAGRSQMAATFTADPRRHRPLAARAPQPLGKDARGHNHGSSHRQGEAPSEAPRDAAGTNPDMT